MGREGDQGTHCLTRNAVVTNLEWQAPRLLEWHREKAGTVEHVHDELKNGLAAEHMPSQRFAVNAAWLKLTALSYNVASAIRGLCLNAEERTARFKRGSSGIRVERVGHRVTPTG